jgi:uncharacterized protein YqjF (DUF2071 family)
MRQNWEVLLFAHWQVDPAELRAQLPSGLALDTYEGEAWVGIVPFRMSGVRPRFVPPLPGLSAFPELNVRTYVTDGSKAGVWFFSLDATNRVAVWGARRFFSLPYFHARMEVTGQADKVVYDSRRTDARGRLAEFHAKYGPTGQVSAPRGSLAHWLTARYCLYASHRGSLYRTEIDHPPWPLQAAEADIELNTMAAAFDIRLLGKPLLHYSEELRVRVWPPVRVGA